MVHCASSYDDCWAHSTLCVFPNRIRSIKTVVNTLASCPAAPVCTVEKCECSDNVPEKIIYWLNCYASECCISNYFINVLHIHAGLYCIFRC